MNESRLQEYLNLINGLLDCPSGEEVELLRSHETLIDADFIRVTERVAEQMAIDGEQDAADFLQDLMAQLNEAFAKASAMLNPESGDDRKQAYLYLINELLNCSSEEEINQALNTHSDLIDAGLVGMLVEVSEALTENGDEEAANFLSDVAFQLAEALGLGLSEQ
jgi:ubiquitin C-terminal hydrolase